MAKNKKASRKKLLAFFVLYLTLFLNLLQVGFFAY